MAIKIFLAFFNTYNGHFLVTLLTRKSTRIDTKYRQKSRNENQKKKPIGVPPSRVSLVGIAHGEPVRNLPVYV